MYMHPKTYLWLHEQERERTMAQAALARAARSGREPGPGLVKGGIASLAHALRRAASAAGGLRLGGSRPTSKLTGSTGG
jgi:phytoene dehydrogenase-like protein